MLIDLLHSLNDGASYNFSAWVKADITDSVPNSASLFLVEHRDNRAASYAIRMF
jgi:hypothetical protein